MKNAYLLTLWSEDSSDPVGKILLVENDIDLIIKGINTIEEAQGDYYQTYASDIHIYGDPKYPNDGTYKDGVRWSMMRWDIDEMKILQYS